MKMRAEAGGGLQIGDGTYLLRLVAVEEIEIDTARYEKARGVIPGVRFHFVVPEVLGEDGEPGPLDGRCTAEKLTPRTKLWAWVEALTGCPLEPDTDIDLDALVSCEAMGSIVNEPDENGIMWPRIKTLVALPKGQSTSRQSEDIPPPPKPQDQFEGFRNPKGEIHWGNFAGRMQTEEVAPGDIARFLGTETERPSKQAMSKWVLEDPSRTLLQLLEDTKAAMAPQEADPDDLPFE